MVTFEQAYSNVVKLHKFFLSDVSQPLIPEVFQNSVNHYGWTVSHMLARFWKDPSRYATPPDTAHMSHEGDDIVLPSHLGAALLLHPNRTVSEVSYKWSSVPHLSILAFANLGEPEMTKVMGLFESSIIDWLKHGAHAASDETILARKSVCASCPSWSPKGYLGLGKCMKCGCSVAKLYMSTSKCILGKW